MFQLDTISKADKLILDDGFVKMLIASNMIALRRAWLLTVPPLFFLQRCLPLQLAVYPSAAFMLRGHALEFVVPQIWAFLLSKPG